MKTPNTGAPGSIFANPGSGQERKYGDDGQPEYDIDWDHDHGFGAPHAHNWQGARRCSGIPVSPWLLDRKSHRLTWEGQLMEHHTVTLIVDEHFTASAAPRPGLSDAVWIVRSVTNDKAVEVWKRQKAWADMTTFERQPDESIDAMCARIVESLDQHYDEFSQANGYTELDVIGVQLSVAVRHALQGCGFVRFEPTPRGFTAYKAVIPKMVVSGASANHR